MGTQFHNIKTLNPFEESRITKTSYHFFPSKIVLNAILKDAKRSKEDTRINQVVKRLSSQIKDKTEIGQVEFEYLIKHILTEYCNNELENAIKIKKDGDNYYLYLDLTDKDRTIIYRIFKTYTVLKAQRFSEASFSWRFIIDEIQDVFSKIYYDLACLKFIKVERIMTKRQILRQMNERRNSKLYTFDYFFTFYSHIFPKNSTTSGKHQLYTVYQSDAELIQTRDQQRGIVRQAKVVLKKQKSPDLYRLHYNILEKQISESPFKITAEQVIHFVKTKLNDEK